MIELRAFMTSTLVLLVVYQSRERLLLKKLLRFISSRTGDLVPVAAFALGLILPSLSDYNRVVVPSSGLQGPAGCWSSPRYESFVGGNGSHVCRCCRVHRRGDAVAGEGCSRQRHR